MTEELEFINFNERAYKYIRQYTVKSANDALIELITNCVDAYNRGGITDNRKIDIEFWYPNRLIVRDHAIGLDAEQLRQCFLQVGEFTNIDSARGFFSRGAKDISAIANITFNSVKDGKYSQCYLNTDAYGAIIIENIEATQDIRDNIKIPNNGLEVVLDISDIYLTFDPSDQAETVSKLAVLRDIVVDDKNVITYTAFNEQSEEIFSRRLLFDYPEAEQLLDLEYNVPNYPEAVAHLTIFKSFTAIPQPVRENEMIFGFLIKDSHTVYEITTLDDRFRWNPYMHYVYGHVSCDYIGKLLRDYDTLGSTAANPTPIIDPSRITGVNKTHPFIESLLSIPKVRVDQVLRELNQSLSQRSITINEVSDILEELSKYGLNMLEEEEIKMRFVPSYDAELAKAIEDDRMNYVTKEKNYLLTGNYNINITQEDGEIKEQILKIEVDDPVRTSFVVDEDNNIVQIEHDTNNPVDVQTLESSVVDTLSKRPYIYKLSPTGDIVKLYIFEKGRIENITNPENEYVVLKNKKFQISFINDINVQQRYILEYENGIHIKLNLSNHSISSNLANDRVNNDDELSVTNMTSTKSLIFLRELVTDIFSDIILENDVVNSKLVLDSNNFNNTKKILLHRNQIQNKIEVPIDSMFSRYITENKSKKTVEVQTIVDRLSDQLTDIVEPEQFGTLSLIRAEFDNKLSEVIE